MDFKLTKDEIKITPRGTFYPLIHPRLLDDNVSFDPNLAESIFPRVEEEWLEELRKVLATTSLDGESLWYLDFLKEGKPSSWKCQTDTDERGFARFLMIERNHAGSLGFRKGLDHCETYIPLDGVEGRYFHLPKQKALELSFENRERFGRSYTYAAHNITHLPAAIFMRTWYLNYVNAAMASI